WAIPATHERRTGRVEACHREPCTVRGRLYRQIQLDVADHRRLHRADVWVQILAAWRLQVDGAFGYELHETHVHPCRCIPCQATKVCRRNVPRTKKGAMNGEIDHLLFEDKSMIRDYQALQRTWFEKGKQRDRKSVV